MTTKNEMLSEAVQFRCDPFGSNRSHCSVWNMMDSLGGAVAINYGIYKGIPPRNKNMKREAAYRVAKLLEDRANEA